MPEASDGFNDHARSVLHFAWEEAQRFNHEHIGTEHLLLGVIREQDGVGARVLSRCGVTHDRVQSAVRFIRGQGERAVTGDIGLSPRATKVLELARDQARELDHDYVGSEHLLLGLLQEDEGIAMSVLQSLGVKLERVWADTFRVLGIPPSQRPDLPLSQRWRQWTVQVLRQRLERRQLWSIQGYSQIIRPIMGLSSLTTGAIRAIEEAELTAWWLNHREVGTGHLLVGLIREHRGVAAQALLGMNITQDLVTAELERLLPRGISSTGAAIDMGPTFQQVLEDAHQMVGPYGGGPIGTEHLLLALLATPAEETGQVLLRRLGTTPSAMRVVVEHQLEPP